MTGKNNNYGFKFQDWDIYNDALNLRSKINELAKSFPSDEKFALVDQIRRAVNSIILNIAEGSNKTTDKDRRLYINRAHGSLDEVVACLDCALSDRYITKNNYEPILLEASSLAKRLRGFFKYLS